ncbi:unnamed protein product [Ectocarpus sp. 12 AP-2014]
MLNRETGARLSEQDEKVKSPGDESSEEADRIESKTRPQTCVGHGSSLTAHGRWRSSKSIHSGLDRFSGEGKAWATTIRANYKAHSLHPVHHQPKDLISSYYNPCQRHMNVAEHRCRAWVGVARARSVLVGGVGRNGGSIDSASRQYDELLYVDTRADKSLPPPMQLTPLWTRIMQGSGKDCTGLVTALSLAALGVPDVAIVDDCTPRMTLRASPQTCHGWALGQVYSYHGVAFTPALSVTTRKWYVVYASAERFQVFLIDGGAKKCVMFLKVWIPHRSCAGVIDAG